MKLDFQRRRVASVTLFEYLDWVQASSGAFGIPNPLTLPPVQRSALWRPSQVLDLWRSLLVGMPVGALYLSPPGRHRRMIDDGSRGTTTEEIPESLPPAQAGKCVWIVPSADGIAVHLTTRNQPFGFTRKDEKLRDERRAARSALEAGHGGEDGPLEGKADHQLYDWHIGETAPDGWPPPPHLVGAAGETGLPVAPLHALVAALRANPPDGTTLDRRLAAIFDRCATSATGASIRRDITPTEVAAVRHALAALEGAEIPLILAAPRAAPNGAVDPDWTLTLYDRIGTGGTPLSGAERLFSIYKYHAPYVHDAVMRIEEGSGRIMAPVEIAVTAICIAAARHPTRPSFAPPEAREFGRWMRSSDQEHERFRECLELLIQWEGVSGGVLAPAFRRVHSLLTSQDDPRSLPPLLVASLRPELLRVLIHWAVLTGGRPDAAVLDASARSDIVRFALFWHFCVTDPGKAARHAMRCIAQEMKPGKSDAAFPWKPLVEALVGEDPSAVGLVHPSRVEAYGKHQKPSSALRGWNERFDRVVKEESSDLPAQQLFRRWWEATDLLLWLQRAYLQREFKDYDPTSEREEDKPVDLDHIQPKAAFDFHFGGAERRFEAAVTKEDRAAFHRGRWLLGNSIGNYRWVSSSVNRSDGDCPVAEKLAVDDAVPPVPPRLSFADCNIDPGSRELWKRASGPTGGQWSADRIESWQQVVEERAVWLYWELWQDAGFDAWFSDTAASDRMQPSSDAKTPF